MASRHASLRRLYLLSVNVLPLFALLEYKAFGVFESLKETFPLDQVTGLAAGHEIIHSARSTLSVRMNMINSQNHPVCELMQAI